MKRELAAALLLMVAAAAPATGEAPQAGPEMSDELDLPDDPETQRLKIELAHEMLRAQIADTQFASATNAYQQHMYAHHQFWTDAAAVMVYLITLFGLFCSAVQFRLVARLKGKPITADEASAGAIELPGGAKMSSPFLGLLVLFVSLAFFYLYLMNVYPIVSVAELEAKRAGASAASPPAAPPKP